MAVETTFRCGGNAALFVTADDLEELKHALSAVKAASTKYVILGNGSNVLFTDSGPLCAEGIRNGWKVLGYLHGGNPAESFPGAEYVLQEPDEIDRDSWQKIGERLRGMPWTILRTERCVVRELTEDDLDSLYELYDEQALRFLEGMSADREKEREILKAYIREVYGFYGCGVWGVFLKENDIIRDTGFRRGIFACLCDFLLA